MRIIQHSVNAFFNVVPQALILSLTLQLRHPFTAILSLFYSKICSLILSHFSQEDAEFFTETLDKVCKVRLYLRSFQLQF